MFCFHTQVIHTHSEILPPSIIMDDFRSDVDEETNKAREAKKLFPTVGMRHKFVQKVYGIIIAQLVLTIAIVVPFVVVDAVREFAKEYWWLSIVFAISSFILLLAIECGPMVLRRKVPLNFFLLFFYTLLIGAGLGFSVAQGKEEEKNQNSITVAISFGITVAIVLVFTLFAFQTKFDMTKLGGILFMLLIVFCLLSLAWGIAAALVTQDSDTFYTINLVVSCIGVLVFVALLIYDTQLLLGGKHKYSISEEEYIMGALMIYLDIVNIFRQLLNIVISVKELMGDD